MFDIEQEVQIVQNESVHNSLINCKGRIIGIFNTGHTVKHGTENGFELLYLIALAAGDYLFREEELMRIY